MCGVAGSFQAANAIADPKLIRGITRSQWRRGPDHERVIRAESPQATMILGHNRLSIIDLSDAANQPMWDTAGDVCIAYNGEIYNYLEIRNELRGLGHEFRTASDTEVIIEAYKRWGTQSFERLNGMFAFAIFDRRDGGLTLVRDRFGVKPLYYGVMRESVIFASTPGPIANALASPPNFQYLSRGLHYWIYEDDSSVSPFDGVHAVPSGTYVTVSVSLSAAPRIAVHSWYDFETRVASLRDDLRGASNQELVNRFASVLEKSVSLRLRADVPLGISLSGGLDSSSIASLMASMGASSQAFSYGDPDDSVTEGPLVRAVASDLGFPVTYAPLADGERIDAFWETLDAQGAPFPDTSIVAQYAVFKAARASGLKVLLGGQGSDEALMGYRKFQLVLLREAVRNRDPVEALRVAGGMSLMLRAELRRASTYLRQWSRYSRRGGMKATIQLPEPESIMLLGASGQPAWRRQIDDMRALSLPTLLRYEDRNSMANSLETRLPFLDFHIAELSVALPDGIKVRRGYGKWILREAMKGRIPEQIRRARYKRGFDAPRAAWVHAGLGASIRSRLRELGPSITDWLPRGGSVERLFSDDRLVHNPTAFAEGTTLLWLGQHA